jgi:hypothetical protein
LQFAATTIRAICRLFQLLAFGRSFFGRTFNPKVAGSIPARPIGFAGKRHAQTVEDDYLGARNDVRIASARCSLLPVLAARLR